ncbi:MAG: hypothetical protein J6I58_01575 [Eubacterium sp.]|nr:hypothetical protein [Eubacterium sp.]
MNLYTSGLIPNLEKAFTGEEVRSSLIDILTAVNEEHHKKMFSQHPYAPGDDDPEGHVIEDTEEENNG